MRSETYSLYLESYTIEGRPSITPGKPNGVFAKRVPGYGPIGAILLERGSDDEWMDIADFVRVKEISNSSPFVTVDPKLNALKEFNHDPIRVISGQHPAWHLSAVSVKADGTVDLTYRNPDLEIGHTVSLCAAHGIILKFIVPKQGKAPAEEYEFLFSGRDLEITERIGTYRRDLRMNFGTTGKQRGRKDSNPLAHGEQIYTRITNYISTTEER